MLDEVARRASRAAPGSTACRPSRRGWRRCRGRAACQMRLTSVRGIRPLRGSVKIAAAVARRSASDADGAARASSGKRNAGSAYSSCATSQRYSCSFGSGEKYAASPYASFSFHLLTKLSWQALHFRLTPRNTCAVFCDACIHGVTAALVSPRQLTPIRNPSGSPGCAGLSSLRDELVVRQVARQRRQQPVVMLLRPPFSRRSTSAPSSLRSRSFQNEIQCSAYFLSSASSVATRRRACRAR